MSDQGIRGGASPAGGGSFENGGTAGAAPPDSGLGDLLGRLSEQFSRLVQQEIALAKSELRGELAKVRRAAGLFGVVAAAAVLALLMLAFAAAWGLAEVIAPGLAFLIVAVVLGIVAAVLFQRARSLTEEIEPVPQRTVSTLKEDAEWAKDRRT